MSDSEPKAITGLEVFGLIQAKHRLHLEITTGMTFRQSTLAAVNRLVYRLWPECGPKAFTRKQQAYDWLVKVTDELTDKEGRTNGAD